MPMLFGRGEGGEDGRVGLKWVNPHVHNGMECAYMYIIDLYCAVGDKLCSTKRMIWPTEDVPSILLASC